MNKQYKIINIIVNTISNKDNDDNIKVCFNILDISNKIKEFYRGNLKDNLIKEYKYNLNNIILNQNRFCYIYNNSLMCALCFLRPLNTITCGNHNQHELNDMQTVLITYTNFYKTFENNNNNIPYDILIKCIQNTYWT